MRRAFVCNFTACLFADLEHAGEDCYQGCNQRDGKCNWCGGDGWCCRKGWVGNGCDGKLGGDNRHECSLKSGKPIFRLTSVLVLGKNMHNAKIRNSGTNKLKSN